MYGKPNGPNRDSGGKECKCILYVAVNIKWCHLAGTRVNEVILMKNSLTTPCVVAHHAVFYLKLIRLSAPLRPLAHACLDYRTAVAFVHTLCPR